jgi:AAA domain
MPIPASALEDELHLRLLILSWPKKGATTHAVSTSPSPVRVLLCEATDSALKGAKRETSNFDFDRIRGWDTMTKAIVEAKKDAREGKIKTVVVDPLNFFADVLMAECTQATLTKDNHEDGRRAHPEFTKRIKHVINLLQTIPAHLVVINHYMEVGGDEGNDSKPKNGPGIVPLMPNMASRTAVAAMFHDIVWFDTAGKDQPNYNNRIFVTSADGVWGPGCRSLTKYPIVPAHVGQLIKTIAAQKNGAGRAEPPPGRAAQKPQQVRRWLTSASFFSWSLSESLS